MKYKLLILLTLLILSCSENANPLSDNIDNNNYINSTLNFTGSDNTLDIITWNIEWFPKNEMTIEYVKESIDSLNVDIIALQEITSTAELNNLKESLWGNWEAYRSGYGDYGELSFLINTDNIVSHNIPYTILGTYYYDFSYREPYVLEFSYNNENFYLINVHLKCCGNGTLDLNDETDEETRRYNANQALYNYIISSLNGENVLIVGDYNDLLTDNVDNNVFEIFLNDSENFQFTDYNIANGSQAFWSFPSWPSHLDHILITNELFDNNPLTATVLIDNSMNGYFESYEQYISDHRPVGISLYIVP